jgi:hypothetical protein
MRKRIRVSLDDLTSIEMELSARLSEEMCKEIDNDIIN